MKTVFSFFLLLSMNYSNAQELYKKETLLECKTKSGLTAKVEVEYGFAAGSRTALESATIEYQLSKTSFSQATLEGGIIFNEVEEIENFLYPIDGTVFPRIIYSGKHVSGAPLPNAVVSINGKESRITVIRFDSDIHSIFEKTEYVYENCQKRKLPFWLD